MVLGWTNASEFWPAIDCAISTSDNEGMPIALIEAQLAGVPTIARDVGSTTEVVKNGVTGIIIDVNPQSYIKAIRFLQKKPMTRKKMKHAAKIRATKLFSVESFVSAHQAVYKYLINTDAKK